jgi:hypothetical protein
VQSNAFFGAIASFNSTGSGFRVPGVNGASGNGANITTQPGGSGVNRIWGSGHATSGVQIGPGCILDILTGANATITGSTPGTNDFALGGVATARAWDETADGGFGKQTLPIVCSWANYNLSVAGGGFGGNARNYENGAAIVKR